MPTRYRAADPNYTVYGRVPILTSRFRFAGRRTIAGRARLYADHIELSGWEHFRHFRRRIPLGMVGAMYYHLRGHDGNLTLELMDGVTMHLLIEEAHRWREHYEAWLRYDTLPSAKLRSDPGESAALAG